MGRAVWDRSAVPGADGRCSPVHWVVAARRRTIDRLFSHGAPATITPVSCGWTPRAVVSLVLFTLSAGFAVVWWFFGESTAAAVATGAAAVLAAVPVVDSLRTPRDRPSRSRVVAELGDQLAERVEEQWEAEAVHRQLRDPQPIAVRWSEAAANVMDHPDLILPNARRLWLADSVDHVVDAYRALPR